MKFYINFWIISALVLTVGVVLGKYEFNFELIKNGFFGTGCGVMEWWFVQAYFIMLLTAPAIVYLFNNKTVKRAFPLAALAFLYLLIKVLMKLDFIPGDGVFAAYFWQLENIPLLLSFLSGILFSRYNIYIYIYNELYNIPFFKAHYIFCSLFALAFVCGFRILFCNSATDMTYDFIIVPFFVFFCTVLFENSVFENFLCFMGKHSTNIWLTHTFWCYYYFQNIVLLPRYSPLIYVWLVILSLGTSFLINLIYIPVYNKLFSAEHKFTYKGYFKI